MSLFNVEWKKDRSSGLILINLGPKKDRNPNGQHTTSNILAAADWLTVHTSRTHDQEISATVKPNTAIRTEEQSWMITRECLVSMILVPRVVSLEEHNKEIGEYKQYEQ